MSDGKARKEQALKKIREVQDLLKSAKTRNVEDVRAALQGMFEDLLSSDTSIFDCAVLAGIKLKPSAFASYRIRKVNVPEFMKEVDWRKIMGALRNQKDHDVCWAIVVSELIRVIRILDGRGRDEDLYSPQDLIYFARPDKRKTINPKNHTCYALSREAGYQYVMENGIQREADRPFIGCSRNEPDQYRDLSTCVYIKGYETISSMDMDKTFEVLKKHPLSGALAIFQPEYSEHQREMYRGATSSKSQLVALHAVTLLAVDEDKETGERFIWARSSQGSDFGYDGCIKVSLGTYILHLPKADDTFDEFSLDWYLFSTPSLLISPPYLSPIFHIRLY